MAVFITDEDRAIWARFQPENLRWTYYFTQVYDASMMVAMLRTEPHERLHHWLRATWGMPWEQQLEVLHG